MPPALRPESIPVSRQPAAGDLDNSHKLGGIEAAVPFSQARRYLTSHAAPLLFDRYQIMLLGDVCERLAQSYHLTTLRPGVEPAAWSIAISTPQPLRNARWKVQALNVLVTRASACVTVTAAVQYSSWDFRSSGAHAARARRHRSINLDDTRN